MQHNDTLHNKTLLIVGAGGTAYHSLPLLARLHAQHDHTIICDPDETDGTQAQQYYGLVGPKPYLMSGLLGALHTSQCFTSLDFDLSSASTRRVSLVPAPAREALDVVQQCLRRPTISGYPPSACSLTAVVLPDNLDAHFQTRAVLMHAWASVSKSISTGLPTRIRVLSAGINNENDSAWAGALQLSGLLNHVMGIFEAAHDIMLRGVQDGGRRGGCGAADPRANPHLNQLAAMALARAEASAGDRSELIGTSECMPLGVLRLWTGLSGDHTDTVYEQTKLEFLSTSEQAALVIRAATANHRDALIRALKSETFEAAYSCIPSDVRWNRRETLKLWRGPGGAPFNAAVAGQTAEEGVA